MVVAEGNKRLYCVDIHVFHHVAVLAGSEKTDMTLVSLGEALNAERVRNKIY